MDNVTVHSYYLVLEKLPAPPNIDDTIVANESSGFIETVMGTFKADKAQYVETRLLRCTDNFPLNKTRQEFDQKSCTINSILGLLIYLSTMRQERGLA